MSLVTQYTYLKLIEIVIWYISYTTDREYGREKNRYLAYV